MSRFALCLVICTLLAGPFAGCTIFDTLMLKYLNERPETMSPDSIGEATMQADGTITLRLRAESEDGAVGDGLFTYTPTDKDYASILDHLGGLKPGETKPVPPWPEN